MNYKELEQLVIQWGKDKGILDKATPLAQAGKTKEEVEELKYACLLMYGSENKAVISEIAFCFGIDKTVTRMYDATGNELVNAPAFTKEYVACHMGVVESTFKPIIYTGEINDTKNIGISEPLYGGR